MSEPVLQFERVSKSFGTQSVLDGLRLVIDPGEFFALVGVNGAGKTTLIKSLLDFTAIESGAITVFGTSHTLTKARERLVFLPERFIPPYFLKGRDFLTYMSRLHGVVFGPGEVEKVLMALDLEFTALDKPVREFSKGMAQKLGLAACLLSGKELMILDEPMSGLDP
ncbi:MAG: ABC transporter ATP-binding protein, partial [Gammaproteobacteria bacterium]|nr:ABC transporter ATP-binding protein [Gammaproteobacteria bacterium]